MKAGANFFNNNLLKALIIESCCNCKYCIKIQGRE